MTAFFCSRSACGSSRLPCSSTDDRICRNWMRVSPDVSCASRSTESSERALNHSASRTARRNRSRSASSGRSTSISTVCGERTTRELTSARFSVMSTNVTLAASSAGSVDHFWMNTRTARSSALDSPADSGISVSAYGNTTATPSAGCRCTTCLRNESSRAQNATGSRGNDTREARAVHRVDDGHRVGEVLVRLARVEDRAVRALVLDHDVALPEHPVGEKRREGHEVGDRRAARRPPSAPAPDRACCRAARTCCRAGPGCRARACAPSADSGRTRWSSPLRFRPDASRSAPCCSDGAGGASDARSPASPSVPFRSSDSISRTMRSESSDCRTIVSSSSEIACGSRSEIEFWCSTSSSDSIESSSVTAPSPCRPPPTATPAAGV